MRHQFTENNQPIFQKVFAESWDHLPPVMKKHYAVRPYSDDVVKIEVRLDVNISFFVSPMARLTNMLVPYSGNDLSCGLS